MILPQAIFLKLEGCEGIMAAEWPIFCEKCRHPKGGFAGRQDALQIAPAFKIQE
ncbi:hypothetical protein AA0323_0524 [Asaia siamensis NRIC 0323]|nr:hypothetical protein AA0323_0524 [Asaia siamensis NRIC 0323]